MAVPANCKEQFSFDTPCYEKVKAYLESSLGTLSSAGIAIGVIEIIGLIFSAVLFTKLARRERTDESLMSETWRINRNKVQYGYQNYQYA